MSEVEKSTERPFNLMFFLKRFPPKVSIYDVNLFTAWVTPEHRAAIISSSKNAPGAEFFTQGAEKLVCIGIRVDADKLLNALSLGRHIIDGIIDGFSIALNRGSLPIVSSLVIVCDGTDPVGKWVSFSPIAWTWFGAAKPSRDDEPDDRTKILINAVIPFFDVITRAHPNHDSSLARQIAQSLKMYRHGASADSFAVEFICKCSALEGLVCAHNENKGERLRTRLPILFREDASVTSNRIKKIWKDRNLAIHESAGFYSEHSAGSHPVQAHLNEINYLFRGTVSFALSHLKDCATVKGLWRSSETHQLPVWALDRRSDSTFMAAHNTIHETHLKLPDINKWFDACLKHAREERNAL